MKNGRLFVISDTEMGRGDIMDDFSDDAGLCDFIANLTIAAKAGEEITLVLNGDVFDFLKMDYQGEYSRYITEEISFWKLEQVMKTHASVLSALKAFVAQPTAYLVFVIGNHDSDLVWKALQERLWDYFGQSERVSFTFRLNKGDLHIEHGHLQDPFFKFDENRPIVEHKGKKILNLPIGSHIVSVYLAPLKRKFPKEEAMYPKREMLDKCPEFRDEIRRLYRRFSWKSVVWDPLMHLGDPTFRVPYGTLIKHLLQYGVDFADDDVDDKRFITSRFKKLADKFSHSGLFVLGHSHILSKRNHNEKLFFITDTWRNEYRLVEGGLEKKERTFAEIIYKDGNIIANELKIFVPGAEECKGG